ncbi:MAG: hypothetical protein LBK00_05310 [Treponema sp.]|jgi:hypothetical protein|nr:hypothetical protein [Treponema sp.]
MRFLKDWLDECGLLAPETIADWDFPPLILTGEAAAPVIFALCKTAHTGYCYR